MKFSFSTLVLAASFGVTSLAHASSVTSATVYLNTPDAANAADTANEGATLASANFTVGSSGINFQSPPAAFTIGSFLNNPTFSNTKNGFSSTSAITSIELVITGYLSLNAGANSFVVGHDDGVVLTVGGATVVNAPGPTSYSTSPFTVNEATAGTYAFNLEYAECCGAPADLTFAINNTTVGPTVTPEPSSLILLGSGIATTAAFMRRRLIRKA